MNAWSYSRLKSFETCPRQFHEVKVLRNYEEPETEAIRYGNAFHLAAEEYIRDNTPLPGRFTKFQRALDALNALPGDKLCENKMGLKADLTACGFFDDDVWYRGIADLIIVNGSSAKVIDYKTGGNVRYADPGQLELMALCTFAHHPDIEEVKAALMYVVINKFIKSEPDTFTRADIPKLWTKWLPKHAALEKAFEVGKWNPRPSGLCKKHCIVDTCEHNGRNQ